MQIFIDYFYINRSTSSVFLQLEQLYLFVPIMSEYNCKLILHCLGNSLPSILKTQLWELYTNGGSNTSGGVSIGGEMPTTSLNHLTYNPFSKSYCLSRRGW